MVYHAIEARLETCTTCKLRSQDVVTKMAASKVCVRSMTQIHKNVHKMDAQTPPPPPPPESAPEDGPN